MGKNSMIEWLRDRRPDGTLTPGHTFNAWRGCTKVSHGCTNCYADTLSGRNPTVLGIWGMKGTRPIAGDDYWKQPLAWDRAAASLGERHRVFAASLSDVFEVEGTMPGESWEPVREARRRLLQLVEATPNLDWLLLTKRIAHAQELAREVWGDGPWPDNAWIGTSVENQQTADERIPELIRIPAKVRFLSCEPLLGPVDLSAYLAPQWYSEERPAPRGIGFPETVQAARLRPRVDWMIVGGESGPSARPMHPEWARQLRDQAVAAGVRFFFKQWGEYAPVHDLRANEPGIRGREWYTFDPDTSVCRVGKGAAGHMLDGREWREIPGRRADYA